MVGVVSVFLKPGSLHFLPTTYRSAADVNVLSPMDSRHKVRDPRYFLEPNYHLVAAIAVYFYVFPDGVPLSKGNCIEGLMQGASLLFH